MGISESKNNYGFRILKFNENSPLQKSGVKCLEDFIIPPDGINDSNFKEFLNKLTEKTFELKIYNLFLKSFFKIKVTLENGCLGALISYENYLTAHLNLLKILRVNENSLAMKIGLMPQFDFIVGVKTQHDNYYSLNSKNSDPLSLFTNFIKLYKNRKLTLFVINSIIGAKIIDFNLNNEILGCDVGDGNGKGNELIKKSLLFDYSELRNINNSYLSNSLADSFIINSNNKSEISSIDFIDKDNKNYNLEDKSLSLISSNSSDN